MLLEEKFQKQNEDLICLCDLYDSLREDHYFQMFYEKVEGFRDSVNKVKDKILYIKDESFRAKSLIKNYELESVYNQIKDKIDISFDLLVGLEEELNILKNV